MPHFVNSEKANVSPQLMCVFNELLHAVMLYLGLCVISRSYIKMCVCTKSAEIQLC